MELGPVEFFVEGQGEFQGTRYYVASPAKNGSVGCFTRAMLYNKAVQEAKRKPL